MKNHKNQSVFHRLMGFVRSELEITLAILVLLAFVVGASFAQTTTQTGSDVTISATEATTKLMFNGSSYNGLSFGQRLSGFILVKSFNSAGSASQYFNSEGVTLVNPQATYSFTLDLEAPLDSTPWYLNHDGDGNTTINGVLVTSSAQGINLAGATRIEINSNGGVVLHSFSHAAGTASAPISKVGSLYVAPSATQIEVGTHRTLLLAATDSLGNSADVSDLVSWTSSNKAIASVSEKTGVIQALAPGSVTITATVGSASASATVTVVAAADAAPITNAPTTTQPAANTTSNSWGSSWGNPATATPAAPATTTTAGGTTSATTDTTQVSTQPSAVDTAVASLFSPAAVAARVVATNTTHVTQTEMKAATASLPTLSQKISFSIKVGVAEIGQTVKEMVLGLKISDPATGKTITKPSAGQIISGFVLNLIGANPPAQAGTTGIKVPNEVD